MVKVKFSCDDRMHSCSDLHDTLFLAPYQNVEHSFRRCVTLLAENVCCDASYLELSFLLSRNWCVALGLGAGLVSDFTLQIYRCEGMNECAMQSITWYSLAAKLDEGYQYEIISALLSSNCFLGLGNWRWKLRFFAMVRCVLVVISITVFVKVYKNVEHISCYLLDCLHKMWVAMLYLESSIWLSRIWCAALGLSKHFQNWLWAAIM